MLYVYSALLGISIGVLVAALPTIIGVYFGRDQYTRILGLVFAFHIIASAVGGPVAGIIYDMTGTYTIAFAIVLAVSFLGLISVFFARPLK